MATWIEDLATTAAGTWMVIGLFADGWAHLNVPGLESFFTPWHAVLYSGFVAAALWIGLLARRRAGVTGSPTTVRAWQWPVGYGLAAVGVVVFAVGGVSDMLWHLAFGVEVGLEALLSPTHLVLLVGGALVLSAAARSGWSAPPTSGARPTLGTELPAVLSLTLVTALSAFFLIYVSVFTRPAALTALTQIPEGAPGHDAGEVPTIAGLGAYVITSLLLTAPLLLAQIVQRRPPGAVLLLVATVAWLSVSVADWTRYGVITAIALTVAAGVVELVWAGWERARLPEPARTVAMAASLPALLWSAQMAALAWDVGLAWPPELWAGVIGLTVLVSVSLALVAAWRPSPAGVARTTPRASIDGAPTARPAVESGRAASRGRRGGTADR